MIGSPSPLDIARGLLEGERSLVRAAIVGIGGAGCNVVTNLSRLGLAGFKLIAVNTDAASLKESKADYKVLIGDRFLSGRSARTVENGKKAMEEDIDRVISLIKGNELVILVSGLGGGSGTGGHIVLAEELRKSEKDALLVSIAIIPFSSEGERVLKNAQIGLAEVLDSSDLTLVYFNDKLKEKFPDMPLIRAYRIMDSWIASILEGIYGLQAIQPLPGMINVDFAVMKEAAKSSGLGYAGVAEAQTTEEALEECLNDPFGDADVRGCKALVGYIEGSQTRISVSNITKVQEFLTNNLKIPEIYFGLKPSWEMSKPRVFALALGVKSKMVDEFLGLGGG